MLLMQAAALGAIEAPTLNGRFLESRDPDPESLDDEGPTPDELPGTGRADGWDRAADLLGRAIAAIVIPLLRPGKTERLDS